MVRTRTWVLGLGSRLGQPLPLLPLLSLAAPRLVALGLFTLRLRLVASIRLRDLHSPALSAGLDLVSHEGMCA
ncbi:hypothetical protein DRJ54_05355 [Candidatus Acetothermia bacterium]|nr:MAG: hypothetical protein DRJ54_05355 [Candidatus Acetothermia bacterium]